MSKAQILVLAGTNGAGKSSLAGEALRQAGAAIYDPDRAARRYVALGLAPDEANSRAWHRGRYLLEQAIRRDLDFAFETTLGGHTMRALLDEAARRGIRIRVWYVGLESASLHVTRVRQRVARGGHDIPEDLIRRRWDESRRNLIRLLPRLAELVVWDNSVEADLTAGEEARPIRILSMREGAVTDIVPPKEVPLWARPIVAAALRGTTVR